MKKLFIGLLLLGGIGISLLYYYWRQATKLPEWYSSASNSTITAPTVAPSTNLVTSKPEVLEKIKTRIANSQNSPHQSVQVNLDNQDVNELMKAKITEQANKRKVFQAVRAVHTSIKEGKLESGAIVNLSNLPSEQLSDKESATLEKLTKTFPFLKNQDFYVGISGTPRLENEQLQWDDNTKIKVGDLSFSINDLSQRLGIPPDRIKKELDVSMQLGQLKVNNVEVTDNQVLLKGSVK